MERQIKFRGKRLKDGKWIFGNLADYSMKVFDTTIEKKVIFGNILNFATDNFGFVVDDCAVNPDTIGQFTGLLDKNGQEIYEGDILGCSEDNYFLNEAVIFAEGCFMVKDDYTTTPMCAIDTQDRTVIGNIHDNPSLISDKQ